MKSEIRNPNGEPWRPMSSFGHSSFVILSTFVIRVSSLSGASLLWLLQVYERLEIRLPPTAEEPRFHHRGGAYARARHRREHGHLQRCQRSLAPIAALSAARPIGDPVGASSGARD